jgi:hypothetical protein
MKNIKKAQDGSSVKKTNAQRLLEARENRKKLDSITAIKRAEIVRKKDSIVNRNANARGMDRETYNKTVKKESKKPDAVSYETCDPNFSSTRCKVSKKAAKQSKSDFKKMKSGGMLKRADGSYSKKGLWDNIRANKGSGKKPTKQMLQQERKIKAKSKK